MKLSFRVQKAEGSYEHHLVIRNGIFSLESIPSGFRDSSGAYPNGSFKTSLSWSGNLGWEGCLFLGENHIAKSERNCLTATKHLGTVVAPEGNARRAAKSWYIKKLYADVCSRCKYRILGPTGLYRTLCEGVEFAERDDT